MCASLIWLWLSRCCFHTKKVICKHCKSIIYIKHGTNQYGRLSASLTTLCAATVSLSVLNFSVSTWVPEDTLSSFVWAREDQDWNLGPTEISGHNILRSPWRVHIWQQRGQKQSRTTLIYLCTGLITVHAAEYLKEKFACAQPDKQIDWDLLVLTTHTELFVTFC